MNLTLFFYHLFFFNLSIHQKASIYFRKNNKPFNKLNFNEIYLSLNVKKEINQLIKI